MSSANDKATISNILQQIAQAHADKDAAKLASFYKPNTLLFDLAPPLTRHGMTASEIASWFATWDGAIQLDYDDSNTEISGTLAINTALLRMRGIKTTGEEIDLWLRATTCLKKFNGSWLVIHEHTSVPFDSGSRDRAGLDPVSTSSEFVL